MIHRGYSSVGLTALLLLTACGSSADPSAVPSTVPSSAGADAVADAGPQGGQDASGSGVNPKKSKAPSGKHGGDASSDKSGSGPGDSSSSPADPGEGATSPDGGHNKGPGRGSRPAGDSGPVWPAPGVYVYSQKGFEEFCSGTCNRERLPRRQDIDTRVTQRTTNGSVVVTETRSEGQVMRTTTRWSRATALITEVYIKLTYQGFTFEQTYAPSPPVASLRFPLTAGKGWTGTWDGRVSGDYSVSVAGTENVVAAGRSVKAVRLSTRTNFRGEFKGVANATLWLDPRTRALVRTAGNLDVQSSFGRYATGFKTALTGGPGY